MYGSAVNHAPSRMPEIVSGNTNAAAMMIDDWRAGRKLYQEGSWALLIECYLRSLQDPFEVIRRPKRNHSRALELNKSKKLTQIEEH